MESRELLVAQAAHIGESPELYLRASPALRADMVAKFESKLRRDGKRSPHQDVDEYVQTRMQDFPRAEADLKLRRTNSAEIREETTKKRKGRPPGSKSKPKPQAEVEEIDEELEESEELEQPFEIQEGIRVYHDMGDIGEYPVDKMDREGLSVGPILETDKPVDLVGDRPPRTLTDLYSRWPIEADNQYFLRLERTKPKTYQGVGVSGFIGEIRGRRITEVDIANRFGGNEYKITLYGPDPRGRPDEDNRIKTKALTEPITLTVPVYPPIMTTISDNLEQAKNMNPFGPVVAPPTTSGDASIHKANASFFSEALKLQKDDFSKQSQAVTQSTNQLIGVITESSKTQLTMFQEQAKQREEALQRQIDKLTEDVKRAKSEKGEVATEVARAKDEANTQLLKYMEKIAPDKQAEIQRISEYFSAQLESQRRAHDDQMKSLREMQAAAMERLVESNKAAVERLETRCREIEQNYRLLLEQERSQASKLLEQERSQSSKQLDLERSQWAAREAQLRDQMREQSSTERQLAADRITDLKERHEAEIKNLERGHERELRSLRESADVKLTVSKDTSTMMIKQAEERLADAQAEAERAREEAEDAKDLTKQLERAERTAELLGFEKKDASEPKTPWERLAATAGAGVSQLFASADTWLPAVMAQRAAAQAAAANQPPQLRAPQRQVQGAQQQQQQPRPGGVTWAERGAQVRPRTAPAPTTPVQGPPPGFREEVEVTTPPVAPMVKNPTQPPMQAATPTQPPPPPENQVAEPEISEELMQAEFPEKFRQFFSNEAMIGFVAQAEQFVRDQVDASTFAGLMHSAYPDGARQLVENFEPKDLTGALEDLGNTQSPLLRRDGRKWLDRFWKSLRKELKT